MGGQNQNVWKSRGKIRYHIQKTMSPEVQCNLDLVTLNLVTTCDLVTILQRQLFNLLHKIIRFSDIMQFSDSFCGNIKCH